MLLDLENLEIGEITIVGCYGQFDFGLAEQDLKAATPRAIYSP